MPSNKVKVIAIAVFAVVAILLLSQNNDQPEEQRAAFQNLNIGPYGVSFNAGTPVLPVRSQTGAESLGGNQIVVYRIDMIDADKPSAGIIILRNEKGWVSESYDPISDLKSIMGNQAQTMSSSVGGKSGAIGRTINSDTGITIYGASYLADGETKCQVLSNDGVMFDNLLQTITIVDQQANGNPRNVPVSSSNPQSGGNLKQAMGQL
jgi:hypothetical protein